MNFTKLAILYVIDRQFSSQHCLARQPTCQVKPTTLIGYPASRMSSTLILTPSYGIH